MSFLNEFDEATTRKETENGALAYTTTDSKMVDFFAAIGGMRQRDEKDIIIRLRRTGQRIRYCR